MGLPAPLGILIIWKGGIDLIFLALMCWMPLLSVVLTDIIQLVMIPKSVRDNEV